MKHRQPSILFTASSVAVFGWLLAGACALDESSSSFDDASDRAAIYNSATRFDRRPEDQRRFAPGHIIVKFRDGLSPTRQAALMQVDGFRASEIRPLGIGATLWSLVPDEPFEFASVADEEDAVMAAIEAVRERPEVEYAHEDAYMKFSATPSDTLYNQQWHYPSAKFPAAWDSTVGGVKIAVLDSGWINHPDLSGRWTTGYNAVTGTNDAFDYWNYHHGLLVAGILGARTNNGSGIAATCWNCSLMPVRVSQGDEPLVSSASAGIIWAADNGARVINMSFGTDPTIAPGPCSSYPALQSAVNYARSKGVVLVAAAGNYSENTANVSPASCSGVIAVGATGRNGAPAWWSNKGARVDILAPGGDLHDNAPPPWGYIERFWGDVIGCPGGNEEWASGKGGVLSTWAIWKPGKQLLAGDYCYRYVAGTSLSAPHVAGLAALLLSQRPSLTPDQVAARIKGTATQIPGCGYANGCGAGRINAEAAIYPPLPERGMWYNPARSGNGMEIYPRPGKDQIAFAWLTYTPNEQPIWYRAELAPGAGVWEGNLLKSTWNGSSAWNQVVGNAKLRRSNGQWRYEWTLNGLSGNEPIQRLTFGNNQSTMNLTGLWQNNQQPGWLVEFDSRGTTHVGNLLAFAANGQPTWLQGVADSASTSLNFPMLYVKGKNLCPGCVGTPSTTYQQVGTMALQGAAGFPSAVSASTSVTFPGGSWIRPGFTLGRLTGT